VDDKLVPDEGRGRQMTNAERAAEQASSQVMFPGHISLLFVTSALCKVEASAMSTKRKRTSNMHVLQFYRSFCVCVVNYYTTGL